MTKQLNNQTFYLKGIFIFSLSSQARGDVIQLIAFSSYDHPAILAGAGTMGLEIMEQVKNVDAVIIPVGGGGLIAGVSVAIKTLSPNTVVIVSPKLRQV